MTSTTETFLTQEAYDRLQAELADLEGPRRQEIVDRIEAAREEGDLKENGGYHAAKDEQGKIEARIRVLTDLLRKAQVGEAAATSDGTVTPGSVVTVKWSWGEEEIFLLGSREAAGASLTAYSPQSPLGEAVAGHKTGDHVTYTAPNGKDISLEIVKVEPHHG